MQIDVKADLILTVPEPIVNDVGHIVLAVEQYINGEVGVIVIPTTELVQSIKRTKVGVRIHVKDFNVRK